MVRALGKTKNSPKRITITTSQAMAAGLKIKETTLKMIITAPVIHRQYLTAKYIDNKMKAVL